MRIRTQLVGERHLRFYSSTACDFSKFFGPQTINLREPLLIFDAFVSFTHLDVAGYNAMWKISPVYPLSSRSNAATDFVRTSSQTLRTLTMRTLRFGTWRYSQSAFSFSYIDCPENDLFFSTTVNPTNTAIGGSPTQSGGGKAPNSPSSATAFFSHTSLNSVVALTAILAIVLPLVA